MFVTFSSAPKEEKASSHGESHDGHVALYLAKSLTKIRTLCSPAAVWLRMTKLWNCSHYGNSFC